MTSDHEEARPLVLAVDDEERVVQAFSLWLDDEFEVVTATGGTEALEKMHDGIDIVLLDRHMPDMSGDDVLGKIRNDGYDSRVAMVTAVSPDFDIVEMPFDHYVSKPVDQSDLRAVVRRLVEIGEYDDQMSDLYRVTQKIVTLETEMTDSQLDHHEEYNELVERQAQLQQETRETVAELDDDSLADAFEPPGSEH